MTKKEWDAEEVLNTSFFLQLYEKSLDAIVIIDNKNNVLHVNKSFTNMFHYELNEIIGRDINSYIVPVNLLSESEEMSFNVSKSEIVRKDTKRKNKQGKEFWVSIMGLPINLENNKKGVFAVYSDISKAVEEREKSEEANRMKTAILANMSHEFRTPMSAILGFSDILKEELANSDHISMIKDIHSSATRLLNTLNSILELSHLESKEFKPNNNVINISYVIASLSDSFKKLADSKNLGFNLDVNNNNCFCFLDEELFKQIISHVFDNSVKYTSKGGIVIKVSIENNEKGNWCLISVTDTGIGISKENQKLIFNEFRQVSEGISRSYEGSGLGLTLSKKIVDLMGGIIEVESELGFGATIKIYFKLVSNNLLDQTIELNKFSADTVFGTDYIKPYVLLVEDNKTNKVLIKRFLLNKFNVDEVSSGQAAIESIQKRKYDIILMDINLGLGMNGIETTSEIRKYEGYKDVPVIAITGYALSGDKEMILKNGLNGYISKPFTRDTLLDTLSKALVNKV